MAKPILSAAHFHIEDAAFAYVEAHLWPQGPVCPHCGNCDGERIGRLNGKTSRPGLRKCYACRKTFTVRIGTIFEDSHFPLHLWLQAIQLITGSKKGISTRQIQRTFQCSMKTAWFLMHRIREMMAPAANSGPLGGAGKTVEADETALTYSRKTDTGPGRRPLKGVVMSLVERGGPIRSMTLDESVVGIIRRNVHKDSRLVTEGAQHYKFPPVAKHESVDHSKFEWARGDVLTCH